MTNVIKIKNPNVFSIFLGSIIKISPAAELMFSPEGCTTNIFNISRTIKATFSTSAATTEDNLAICLNELKRLQLAVDMISNFIEEDEGFEFIIEQLPSPRITYNGEAKVELNLTNRERMLQFIAEPAKEYTWDFVAKLGSDGFKMLSRIQSVVSEKAKVHLYERESKKGLFAELDDKSDSGSSKAGIPITYSIEKGESQFGIPLIFEFSDFALWNPLNQDEVTFIRIGNNGKSMKAIRVVSEMEKNGYIIDCEMTMASIKDNK